MLILTALAISLELDPTYFTSKHNKHDSTMELKKYHKIKSTSNEDVEYITLKSMLIVDTNFCIIFSLLISYLCRRIQNCETKE